MEDTSLETENFDDFKDEESSETFTNNKKDWDALKTASKNTETDKRNRNNIEIRNRRYNFIKKSKTGDDYFSFEEIRARWPLLYHQYFGNVSQNGRISETNFETFSQFLMDRLQKSSIMETFADQAREELESMPQIIHPYELNCDCGPIQESIPFLEREFYSFIFKDFIDGKDKNFDYSNIDSNKAYDDVKMEEQDAQDDYFDTEEPYDH